MRVETYERGAVTVVALSGELDSRTAPGVQTDLAALVPASGPVLLDLSGTSYLSSAGLRVLLLVYRNAQKANSGRIVLTGLSPDVLDVMSATGFLDFFTVAGDVEAGLEAISA